MNKHIFTSYNNMLTKGIGIGNTYYFSVILS